MTLAFGPVAIYLLLLGMVNLSRRPLIVSGGRDAAALALAVTGMLIVGPFELFLPEPSRLHYGGYAWVMVLAFYGLWVAMGILMLHPRLVIYNISLDKLRPILAEVVAQLDTDARWAGDSLVLPNLEVQLCFDNSRLFRNVSLKSIGGIQNLHGWRRLEQALAEALSRETVSRSPRGLVLVFPALLIFAGLAAVISREPQAITQSIFDLTDAVLKMLNL